MTDDFGRTESVLRSVLASRAEEVPPPVGLYPAVRREVRQRRAVLGAGVAVVLVAAGVPAGLIATRSLGAGPTPAVPAPRSSSPSCPPGDVPVADPGLPVQRGVDGSLGTDTAAVTAVLRIGWAGTQNGMRGPDDPALDPKRTRVHMVQRTDDGWIVGLVTAADRNGGSYTPLLVVGPNLGHLVSINEGSIIGGGPLKTRFLGSDAYLGLVQGCGPQRVVVVAPPGSTATMSWSVGIAADATVDRRTLPVPLGADGVGVVERPVPTAILTLQVDRNGKKLADTWFGGSGGALPGPDVKVLERQLATAPGNGDPKVALQIVRQQFTQLPVRQSDARVLWKGRGNGLTVAAAVSTLAGGAHYVWGGALIGSQPGIVYFDGLVAADALDRTAFVFRPTVSGGPLAVFFTGTHEVEIRIGDAVGTQTITGGLIVPGNATVTVLGADRRPLPLVNAKTGLVRLPEPMN